MKKLNIYYYGEDTSHCSSCRSYDDEYIHIIMTSLTLEEIIEKLNDYCNSLTIGWDGFSNFFSYLSSESVDHQEKTIYPFLTLKMHGTSSSPDLYGNIAYDTTYDADDCLKPNKVVNNWTSLKVRWAKESKIDEEKRRKQEIRTAKKLEASEKKKAENKELKKYLKLKKKWGNNEK